MDGSKGGIVQKFLDSDDGQRALDALTEQGIATDDATKYLRQAAETTTDKTNEAADKDGLLGDHPGRDFFAAFAAGFVKGDGIFGSLMDGVEGVVTGRIAEALCDKVGLDDKVASTIAAIAAPFVIKYLRQHFGGGGKGKSSSTSSSSKD